jgi:Tetracyclin repressor-like, C-terminal domain
VLTMSVFGMINWTFTWLKPDGPLSYAQFAETVVGMLESGLSGGAERMKNFNPAVSSHTHLKKETHHV